MSIATALVLVSVSACTVRAPTAPTVLALPPPGKDLVAFRQEDIGCRSYAQSVAPATAPALAPANAPSLQSLYNGAYTQCMYGHGNTVLAQSPPVYVSSDAYGPFAGFGIGTDFGFGPQPYHHHGGGQWWPNQGAAPMSHGPQAHGGIATGGHGR